MKGVTMIPAALALAAALHAGCRSKEYRIIDIPFCADGKAGEDARLQHDYRVLIKYPGGYHVESLGEGTASAHRLSLVGSDRILFALVSCSNLELRPGVTTSILKDFDEKHVPSVCEGQKTVVHTVLNAEKSDRATALGLGGFFHFPKVDLPCTSGEMIQDNDYTLSQILDDFESSVTAFADKHDRLPATFEELCTDTLAAPLPMDPWGSRLHFEKRKEMISLVSPGPDKKPGTGDEITVLEVERGSSTHLMAFDGVGMRPDARYRKFLEERGVKQR